MSPFLISCTVSKVDENMERAHEPNSVVQNKFFFRKFLAPVCVPEMVAASKSSEYVPCFRLTLTALPAKLVPFRSLYHF